MQLKRLQGLEREKLAFLKDEADYVLDTSKLLTKELKKEIRTLFSRDREKSSLFITVLSFGFKYGIPSDADLVFDVRFLPNPYYVEELRFHTGMEEPVRDYVMQGGTAAEFLEKLTDLLRFLDVYKRQMPPSSLMAFKRTAAEAPRSSLVFPRTIFPSGSSRAAAGAPRDLARERAAGTTGRSSVVIFACFMISSIL